MIVVTKIHIELILPPNLMLIMIQIMLERKLINLNNDYY